MVDVRSGLATIIAETLRHQILGMRGLFSGLFFQLVCLLAGDLLGVFDMRVDQFAVRDVDEGAEINHGSRDQGQTPHGKELDEPVGDESCQECLRKINQIFSPSTVINREESSYSKGLGDVFGE